MRWWLTRRTLRDVTEQLRRRRREGMHVPVHMELVDRRMEELVVEVNAALERADRDAAQGRRHERRYRELVAELSHDLRTPLTAMRGDLQLLAASLREPTQRAQLETARRHTDTLAVLVEEIFEYAWISDAVGRQERAGGGSQSPELVAVDLVEEVGQCLLGLAGELAEAEIEVTTRAPDTALVMVEVDALRRILNNLVRNVLQHGCERLVVEIEEAPQGVRLRMRNGVRQPELLDVTRVFERHWSSDPAGTGLGLSIVELLAARLGGTVTAGVVGADFEVVLTLAGEALGRVGGAEPPQASGSGPAT